MSSKKMSFHEKPVPEALKDLPRFGFTPSRAGSRAQSSRRDIAFEVGSLDELVEADRRFGAPTPTKRESE